MPIWGSKAITLQPIRAGLPCFGAALAGYVEVNRNDDTQKNRLCPPTPYSNTMAQWVAMTVLGTQATMSFGSHPDIKEWADTVALNPARLPPEDARSSELGEVLARLKAHTPPGIGRPGQNAVNPCAESDGAQHTCAPSLTERARRDVALRQIRHRTVRLGARARERA